MKTVVPPMAAPPMSAEIQFFVKFFDGRTITVKAKSTDTVRQVQDQILKSEGITPDAQTRVLLTYGARLLHESFTLADQDIGEGVTLGIRVTSRGGG